MEKSFCSLEEYPDFLPRSAGEAARAPFSKERRMEFAKATKFPRKSGEGLGNNPVWVISLVDGILSPCPFHTKARSSREMAKRCGMYVFGCRAFVQSSPFGQRPLEPGGEGRKAGRSRCGQNWASYKQIMCRRPK